MIIVFKLFVVIVAGLAPPFIGLILSNVLSTSEPYPAYKHFWAVLSGIAMTYTGTFLYLSSPDQDTGTRIANAFNKALPYMIGVSMVIIILAVIIMVLFWWYGRVRKERVRLLDEARREAVEIIDTLTREAETEKWKAIKTAATTIAEANREAAEIISNATATKQQAEEAMQQVEALRQELEAEYQEKDAELMKKRQAWLDELAGVKADRDRLKERLANILKGSIEHWEKEGSEGAANRRKKQLAKLGKEDADDTQG